MSQRWKQIARAYRYGSVIRMERITRDQHERVIGTTGLWLGLLTKQQVDALWSRRAP